MTATSESRHVIGVGNPIVDFITHVDDQFLTTIDGERGGMVLVDTATMQGIMDRLPSGITRTPGGSAGNTVFAMARMGMPAHYAGKTGDCAEGQFYRESFVRLGGQLRSFKQGKVANGRCLSLVTPDGERTMRTDLGAAMTLHPDEISPADFEGCQLAHIEGYLFFNEALIRKVLQSAHEAGCQISLDMASFEVVHAAGKALPELLEKYVDIVFANEEEAGVFTGLKSDYAEMARMLNNYCTVAAVKAGAGGSFISVGDTVHAIPAVPVEKVIDTTAAGDLWAAGFLYGYLNQYDIPVAGHMGSLLGAAAVETYGAALGEPVWNQLLKQIAQLKSPKLEEA